MEEPRRSPAAAFFTVALGTLLGALGGWGAFFWLGLRVRSKVPSFTGAGPDALVLAGTAAGALLGLIVALRALSRRGEKPRQP